MLREVKKILEEEGLLDREKSLEERLNLAIKIPLIREIFEFSTPQIDNITKYLPVKNGQVYAIRMDLTTHVDNHKKHVVAALLLMGSLIGKIPNPRIDTLIDGGNYSSASALKYYTERFGMKGIYVMSRLFPERILSLLRSANFSIIRAPYDPELPREREFYNYLYNKMKEKEFRKDKFCLWHAKYGGKAMYPFGRELAEKVSSDVNCLVSCLGAGTTLEGTKIPIQDYFIEIGLPSPKIFVAEHELSPLFITKYPMRNLSLPEFNFGDFIDDYSHFMGVPHDILGPHYDEINPLLSQRSIDRVDSIIQYSDYDWKSTQKHLFRKGLFVGNSSAANINVAARLADIGYNVLTVIFEPFREFYKRKIN